MFPKTPDRKPSRPLKWHGGKHYLASNVIDRFPRHVHYVEPYFGGGAVLLAKPDKYIVGHSEVINDLNRDLIAFWQVLQEEKLFASFRRIVEVTPLSKTAWEVAIAARHRNLVEKAVAFFIRYRQSRQGLGKDFATMSRSRTRRGMNEQVSSWLSAVESLPEAHERLKRVAIFCEDAVDVICREDSLDTFFYCDPPYVHTTRNVTNAYACEMDDNSHAVLLDTLGQSKGKFILSGYRCHLYDAAAKRYGWNRDDILIDNKASAAKTKQIKTECLWMNY